MRTVRVQFEGNEHEVDLDEAIEWAENELTLPYAKKCEDPHTRFVVTCYKRFAELLREDDNE